VNVQVKIKKKKEEGWRDTKLRIGRVQKTISSPRAFLAFLAFQSLLKGQKYISSLSMFSDGSHLIRETGMLVLFLVMIVM
jgi:hypothetical protein